jgi:hypothetical protein
MRRSREEKRQERTEKQEEKQQALMETLKNRYGMDDLDPRDLNAVREIGLELKGSGLMKSGMALSLANAADQVTVSYLSAIFRQNWILINQLDRISKKLGPDEVSEE